MPLDSEKKRLEARLLDLLSQALGERNRAGVVSTSVELGWLYLSGDLYEKSEECFRRVLEEPLAPLARAEEKAQAEVGTAHVALRRGHLTFVREALERAEKLAPTHHDVGLEIRKVQCQRDLQVGRYRDAVDIIEGALQREPAEKLGDTRVDFMVLEGRARALLGRNRQAQRLLEKALELAQTTGYEAGAAGAHAELGALQAVVGQFKSAHGHISAALTSDEAMCSQYRLDRDRQRMGVLLLRMGRWDEADGFLRGAYESSRDLRTLENRLASQLGRAELLFLRGDSDEARDLALDAMEVARAAGFVRWHVEGLLRLATVALVAARAREALEFLHEAESFYAGVAPESSLMVQVLSAVGRAHNALGEPAPAFEWLMRAHNLARETGNHYERYRIDGWLGLHFRHSGEDDKALAVLSQAAADLGAQGAKHDVALTRLALARTLLDRRGSHATERHRELRLARSNLFEARRLLAAMGARTRLAELDELEARLQHDPAPSE